MARIERERQAEIAARQPSGQKVAVRIKAAWNVPFLLNASISEDLFRAVKTRLVMNAVAESGTVKYDIRSPGVYIRHQQRRFCSASLHHGE